MLEGDYAGVADEIHGDGPGDGIGMHELDPRYVGRAHAASVLFGLPWPPRVAWEDDVRDAGLYDDSTREHVR